MKKLLMILSAAVLLFTGCAKENSEFGGEGDLVNVTISANVKSTPTRAAVDNDGQGVNANRCIMELWYANKVYGRYEAAVTGYQATFNVTVPAKRTYKVVLWADCATDNGNGTFTDKYYNTSDNLANITLISDYVGNDDARDAFYYSGEQEVTVQGGSFSATLTRPFAQINVITTDVQDIKMVELYPEKVNLAFQASTSFNAVEGTCGELEDIEYEASVYKAYDKSKSELTLSMDYLFASDERSAVDIAFVAPTEAHTEGDFKVEHEFSNIPYQRNYRTNIKGALLTTTGQWTVTINHLWNTPEEDVKVVEAGSVAAANEAFAGGATNVKITSVGEETTLYLPQIAEDVTIDFANPTEAITVKYGPAPTKAGSVKPAAVNIATDDISKFVVTGIDNVIWLVSNQEALANALTKATNKQVVALANDITMTDEWTPVISEKDGNYYYGTFDGRNHTISNLKITDYTGTYAGFFSTVSGATIKNVTFKNATVTNAASNEGARGGIIVGWSYACNIENCHVENSTISGNQKVAGILGAMSVEGAAGPNSVTNCSVKNLTLSCNFPGDALYQSGALVGYIQLLSTADVLIENNSVENITINDDCGDRGNVAYYNGAFIGSIIRKQQADGQKIILKNNTVPGTNTEVFKTLYSSPYFGWTTNTENYNGAIAPLLIDGVEWTPDYPIQNITSGKGYATLAAALSDASANDVITLKGGEYTLPNLSNITLKAVEGETVIVNHSSGSICATNNVTIEGFTFNLGQDGYHGFQHAANLELKNCVFNGFMTTYGSQTFTDCTFNQDTYAYCLNAYGAETTWNNCVFNTKGKAVYVYNEGNDGMYHMNFNNCTFNATGVTEKCKAAILVKHNVKVDGQKYTVNINNCKANFNAYLPDDPDLTGSALWNVEEGSKTGADVKVYINDVLMYDNAFLGIANKLALKNFAAAVNAGKTFEGQTVTLLGDIDLAGDTWTPIGNVTSYPSISFNGIFDGQGYTISNLTCTDNTANHACAGLFGSLMGTVKNVILTNVNIKSTHYAGGICAYSSSSGSRVENCKVIGGTITSAPELLGSGYDNGDKVGGIFGYNGEGGPITGCTVENLTIRAYRDLGGIAGYSVGTISNNSVKNTTVIQDNTNGYKTSVDTYHEIVGRDAGCTLTGNTFENVTLKSEN